MQFIKQLLVLFLRLMLWLGALLFVTSLAMARDEVSNSLPEFSMNETLSFSGRPLYETDLKEWGSLNVRGVTTGLFLNQTNPTAGNDFSYTNFTNAQIIIQNNEGPIRVFAQTGLYDVPVLGMPFTRTRDNTENSYGYLPQAYISIVPDNHWSLMIGKLPAIGGAEPTFTYQNSNIQRGLLWAQTNSVSRGVQLNFADGSISASLSLNDGAYSNVYNWIGGVLGIKATEKSTYLMSWTGSVSANASNSYATPLLQNNSQISNLIYQYSGDYWTFMPYLQYTYIPQRSTVGINGSSGTFGSAILSTYHITPLTDGVAPARHLSIATRVEYESSYGNSLANVAPNGVMYGPGSSAWSISITPTLQIDNFFARTEFAYVKALNMQSGSGFGSTGSINNQARVVIEIGLLY